VSEQSGSVGKLREVERLANVGDWRLIAPSRAHHPHLPPLVPAEQEAERRVFDARHELQRFRIDLGREAQSPKLAASPLQGHEVRVEGSRELLLQL
jgi:hypothetical protein